MASVSTYLSHKILDHCYGSTAFTPAATLYVAFYSTAPNSDGTGGTEISTTGTGYARQAITNNTINFPAAASRIKGTGVRITFPTPTAEWTVAAFKLLDAAIGGNVYHFGLVDPAKIFAVGAPPVIEINGLSISLT